VILLLARVFVLVSALHASLFIEEKAVSSSKGERRETFRETVSKNASRVRKRGVKRAF